MNNFQEEKNDFFNNNDNKYILNNNDEKNKNKKIKISSNDDYLNENSLNINLLHSQNIDECDDLILKLNVFFKMLDRTISNCYDEFLELSKISEELSNKIKLDFYVETHSKKKTHEHNRNASLSKYPSLFVPYKERNFNHIYSLCKSRILNQQFNPISLSSFLEIFKKYEPGVIKLPVQLETIKLCLKYALYQYLEYKIMFSSIYKLLILYIKTENLEMVEFNKLLKHKHSIKILPLSERNQINILIKQYYIDILELENNNISRNLKQNIMDISFEEKTKEIEETNNKNVLSNNNAVNENIQFSLDNSIKELDNNVEKLNKNNKQENNQANNSKYNILIKDFNPVSTIFKKKLNIQLDTTELPNQAHSPLLYNKSKQIVNKISNQNNIVLDEQIKNKNNNIENLEQLILFNDEKKDKIRQNKNAINSISESQNKLKNSRQIENNNINNSIINFQQKKENTDKNIDPEIKHKRKIKLKRFNRKVYTGSEEEFIDSSESDTNNNDMLKKKPKNSSIKKRKKEKHIENSKNYENNIHEYIITSDAVIELNNLLSLKNINNERLFKLMKSKLDDLDLIDKYSKNRYNDNKINLVNSKNEIHKIKKMNLLKSNSIIESHFSLIEELLNMNFLKKKINNNITKEIDKTKDNSAIVAIQTKSNNIQNINQSILKPEASLKSSNSILSSKKYNISQISNNITSPLKIDLTKKTTTEISTTQAILPQLQNSNIKGNENLNVTILPLKNPSQNLNNALSSTVPQHLNNDLKAKTIISKVPNIEISLQNEKISTKNIKTSLSKSKSLSQNSNGIFKLSINNSNDQIIHLNKRETNIINSDEQSLNPNININLELDHSLDIVKNKSDNNNNNNNKISDIKNLNEIPFNQNKIEKSNIGKELNTTNINDKITCKKDLQNINNRNKLDLSNLNDKLKTNKYDIKSLENIIESKKIENKNKEKEHDLVSRVYIENRKEQENKTKISNKEKLVLLIKNEKESNLEHEIITRNRSNNEKDIDKDNKIFDNDIQIINIKTPETKINKKCEKTEVLIDSIIEKEIYKQNNNKFINEDYTEVKTNKEEKNHENKIHIEKENYFPVSKIPINNLINSNNNKILEIKKNTFKENEVNNNVYVNKKININKASNRKNKNANSDKRLDIEDSSKEKKIKSKALNIGNENLFLKNKKVIQNPNRNINSCINKSDDEALNENLKNVNSTIYQNSLSKTNISVSQKNIGSKMENFNNEKLIIEAESDTDLKNQNIFLKSRKRLWSAANKQEKIGIESRRKTSDNKNILLRNEKEMQSFDKNKNSQSETESEMTNSNNENISLRSRRKLRSFDKNRKPQNETDSEMTNSDNENLSQRNRKILRNSNNKKQQNEIESEITDSEDEKLSLRSKRRLRSFNKNRKPQNETESEMTNSENENLLLRSGRRLQSFDKYRKSQNETELEMTNSDSENISLRSGRRLRGFDKYRKPQNETESEMINSENENLLLRSGRRLQSFDKYRKSQNETESEMTNSENENLLLRSGRILRNSNKNRKPQNETDSEMTNSDNENLSQRSRKILRNSDNKKQQNEIESEITGSENEELSLKNRKKLRSINKYRNFQDDLKSETIDSEDEGLSLKSEKKLQNSDKNRKPQNEAESEATNSDSENLLLRSGKKLREFDNINRKSQNEIESDSDNQGLFVRGKSVPDNTDKTIKNNIPISQKKTNIEISDSEDESSLINKGSVLRSSNKKTRITYYNNGSNPIKYIPRDLENYNDINYFIHNKHNDFKNKQIHKNTNSDNESNSSEESKEDDDTDNETKEEALKNKVIIDKMKRQYETAKYLLSERSKKIEEILLLEENCEQTFLYIKPLIGEYYSEIIYNIYLDYLIYY
ncbi:hypothetical protein BCR36DRAFT_448100 [Piromyces finnis]|uniref:Uncharacterized protein n=1 Tax=Piromyces finnis TaxID=1754191 RepID=A0A1Y1VNG2_9FUNG|nr:hypothetical protein BCR36DRAFT_448100 [Piromyces finnis]|eukprot:ORX60171.1 hypothetical protein BCR36DRAFT_448100 [Piromyces finnis]